MFKYRFCRFSGQSLFEVLITLAVAAVLITGIVSLTTFSIGNSSFSGNNTQATKYAEELNEWLRLERDHDWGDFLANVRNSGSACFIDLTWVHPGACSTSGFITGTNLLRQVDFICYSAGSVVACTTLSVDTIQSSIRVSWTDSKGVHTVNVVNRLNKWQEK